MFAAGDPSPVDVRSRALPAPVTAGQPLPAGSSIVVRAIDLDSRRATLTLPCPTGQVVADLLPPDGGRVDAAYARGTVPGMSTSAVVHVRSRGTGEAGIAVLCRRPVGGSIIPGEGARAAAAASGAATAICVRTAHLRATPGGRIEASARLGQPVRLLRRARAWRLLRTDLGQTGWVARSALCAPAAP